MTHDPFWVIRGPGPSGSGDHLSVGPFALGAFRDLVDAEYQRAQACTPKPKGSGIRPMFYTASPYGRALLALAAQARPHLRAEISTYLDAHTAMKG